MRALTVTHAFGIYQPGDQITDKPEMKEAMASNPGFVVAVNLPKPDADTAAEPQKRAAKADDAKTAPNTDAPAPSPSPAS